MNLNKLKDLAEEERQRCMVFGQDPLKSKRYRSLCRSITIREEHRDPTIRFVKRFLIFILLGVVPFTLWVVASTIYHAIKLLVK